LLFREHLGHTTSVGWQTIRSCRMKGTGFTAGGKTQSGGRRGFQRLRKTQFKGKKCQGTTLIVPKPALKGKAGFKGCEKAQFKGKSW